MKEVLFHKHFAWNLVEDAIQSGLITEPKPNSYFGYHRSLGIQEGWINLAYRRRAREVFVLCEKVLLPRGLDIPPEGRLFDENHVTWAGSAHREIESDLRPEEVPELVASYKPILQQALARKGHSISDLQFFRLIQVWTEGAKIDGQITSEKFINEVAEEMRKAKSRGGDELEAMVKHIKGIKEADPRRVDPVYREYNEDMAREFAELQESIALAEIGVPTFNVAPSLSAQAVKAVPQVTEDTIVAVELYFNNVIKCYSPESLKQALDLCDTSSVEHWRAKVFSWSNAMAMGKLTGEEIKREIEEANGYVSCAESLSNLVPRWSTLITIPLGVALTLQFIPGLQPLGWLLIGIDAIKEYGAIVKHATHSPDRLKYKWFMLTNEHKLT